MNQKRDFISLATAPDANVSALCRQFGISRKTGNKYLARFREAGDAGLAERSRRPHTSPRRFSEALEGEVVALRTRHPAWGGRKLRARLLALGHENVPSTSTMTDILARHGLLREDRRQQRDWQRFEHTAPNQLWQMDFKGHFATHTARCHPLTLVDDHSRYNVCLKAFDNERALTVRQALVEVFRCYGLPERILCDNGSPWGDAAHSPHTILSVWLLQLGIAVSHGRPYHPQTQGKEERFHRTLMEEVIRSGSFDDLPHCQAHFDAWREIYNHQRPHEALAMAVPASRYTPSLRPFPEELPPVTYGPGEVIRRVDQAGQISYKGRNWKVGKPFVGQPVALRYTEQEGVRDVYFCSTKVKSLDFRQHS